MYKFLKWRPSVWFILIPPNQPAQPEWWIWMADFNVMNEAHIRILPSVEEIYLFTDTPSNYSSHALNTILKTPVLKPLGSYMLWKLYMESVFSFSSTEIFILSFCYSHSTGPLSIYKKIEWCRDGFTKILNPWETLALFSILIVEMLGTDDFIANTVKWIILLCCGDTEDEPFQKNKPVGCSTAG